MLERVLGLMERVSGPMGRMSGCMARMSGCMGRMLGKMSGWMRGCQVGWQRFGVESGDGRLDVVDVGLVVKDSGYAGEGVG